MGTPLGPKYIPYTYMDPLGLCNTSKPNSCCSPCHKLGMGFGRIEGIVRPT